MTVWFNLLTFIISLVAVSISFHTWWTRRRMLKSNRELQISEPLYNDHLIKTIPKAFDRIIDVEVSNDDLRNFSTEMKRIRSDFRYFHFTHQRIYKKLNANFEDIDLLVVSAVFNEDHSKEWEMLKNKISKKLDNIYEILLYDLPDDRIEQYFHLN